MARYYKEQVITLRLGNVCKSSKERGFLAQGKDGLIATGKKKRLVGFFF